MVYMEIAIIASDAKKELMTQPYFLKKSKFYDKEYCDLINKTFGFNASLSYNKPWAVELEKYTEDVETAENEGDNEADEETKEGAENVDEN